VLGVAPLRSDDNFFDVGGGSLAAVRLFQAIHDHMGVDLPLSTLVRAQTPADMAAVIDSPAEQRVPSAVLLRPGTASRPLFLVHSVSGDVLQLRPLALKLDTDRPVYGIQARGLDPAEKPQTSVDEMAATYVHTVRSLQASGPYDLAGHSFGGLIAFEMARILARQGEQVGWLGLIDAHVHHACLHWPARARFALARPARYIAAAVRAPARRLPRYLPKALLRVAPWAPVAEPPPEYVLPPLLHQLEGISMEAFARYRPGPFPGSATLFLAAEREPDRCDPLPVWRAVVRGPLAVVEIPGGHVDAIAEPNVGVLANRLSARLNDRG
jgi:acetoacetyl-CoA synthetase